MQLLQLFGPIPPKPRSASSTGGVVRGLPSTPLSATAKSGLPGFDSTPLSGQVRPSVDDFFSSDVLDVVQVKLQIVTRDWFL